jgi:hypothetical protein
MAAHGRDIVLQNIWPNDVSDKVCIPSRGDIVLETSMNERACQSMNGKIV